jgi:DNA end-binding protein Ku
MARPIWRGDISFGLVTIPVDVRPAEETREIAFHLLDKKNLAPVKQVRTNSVTGEEVPWDDVVRGYEYEPDRYVVVSDDDLRAANVEATQTIDIVAVVDASEIPLTYYDKPYFLAPATSAARKAYAILRETLSRSDRIGLAYVVIRTRQHVAAVVPSGDALLLELLRFPHELRDAGDIELPGSDLKKLGITDKELQLADQLVSALAEPFDPAKLKDTYHDEVLALLEKKAKGGEIVTPPPEPEKPSEGGEVIDIMSLLKKSVAEVKSARGA